MKATRLTNYPDGDLRSLDVLAYVQDLQKLGQNALLLAFSNRTGEKASLFDEFSKQAEQRLLKLLSSSDPPRFAAKVNSKLFNSLHQVTTPKTLNTFAHRQIAGADLPSLQARSARHVAQILDAGIELVQPRQKNGINGGRALFPAISLMAWRDPDFQHRIATLSRARLENLVVMHPTPDPPVILSPTGFSVLIAMACDQTKQGAKVLRDFLIVDGRNNWSNKNWAGFWDQYLIHLLSPNSRLDPIDPSLFPVAKGEKFSVEESPHSDILDVLKEDWIADVPGYSKYLLNNGF